jgi:hypothetical protein
MSRLNNPLQRHSSTNYIFPELLCLMPSQANVNPISTSG